MKGTSSALVFYTTGGVIDIGIASAIPTGWTVAVPEINGTITKYHINITAPSGSDDFRMLVVATDAKGASASYWLTVQNTNSTGLPVMKINTNNQGITSTDIWVEAALYSIFDADGVAVLNGETAIKGRGNSTWGMPKKPYSLKLSNKTSLLGMSEHKRWALLANYSDKTLLRTEVAFKMGEILDNLAWTPRSVQVDLYLNDEYQGVYQLTEVIKIDENRVDIEEIKKSKPDKGYILEIDARRGELFNFTTTRGVVFCCSDPDDELDKIINGTSITLFEKIQADVQHAEDVLYSANFADPTEGYQKYLDIDSFIDWYLVSEIAKNTDAQFYLSVYMYYDPVKAKYCMGPLWDFDLSSGNCDYADSRYAEGFWIKNSAWIARLFEDPYFVTRLKSRWNAKKAELGAIQGFIDTRSTYLNMAQKFNFSKWNILNVYVWPNVVVPGSYQGEIAYLKQWLNTRMAWLDTAINGL
jgi:hypothetical protein